MKTLITAIMAAALIVGCVTIPDEIYDLIPTTTTTTSTTIPPTTTTTVPPVVDDGNDSTPNAESLHGPVWSTDGATQISRESQQVNNPDNSRKRLKFIASPKRSGTIVRVYCFRDGFQDTLKRATPNESSNRQRYYGGHAPEVYPKNLIIRMDINENGVAKDVYYILKDPTKREG